MFVQCFGALVGLQEARRPFVSSVEVVFACCSERSVGVCLLFYLIKQDLVTGCRLQATELSQTHCCLFHLKLQFVPGREAGRHFFKQVEHCALSQTRYMHSGRLV
ncbi:hypothetical protein ILYODFUR_005783 [Ilyodon furcidens]|uniref:Secreted protein n=1 Tax=Ilyodon furcidens TaxID=33524 RepID=A0ABV0THP8_9TELE